MSRRRTTPVRAALREGSTLQAVVKDGIGALKAGHRDYLDGAIRVSFADSIDIDAALEAGHEEENRWDYLLGHAPSGKVLGLEPHSAKTDEVSTVIRKRRAALAQLAPHLKQGARVTDWLWVASGKVHFANTEKTRLQLDQNGIRFVGTRVLPKDLPKAAEARKGRTRP
jgi:hypothetical protein